MRVLALVTDAYGGQGGIAQAARDVVGGIAELAEVEVVDVVPRKVLAQPDLIPAKVKQAKPRSGRLLFALKALATSLTTRPDVIFCNHLFMAPLAAITARVVNAKMVIQLHGIEIWRRPSKTQRWALEGADILLCVSRDTRAWAVRWCDLPPERAVVLNNTVSSEFKPDNRTEARAKFGFRGEFVMLTVGRLDARERYKGHDRMIEALGDLSAPDGRKLVYAIAGDGDDRIRLEAACQTGAAVDRVRFLGRVPASDLLDLYRAADLFVLPSTGEGFGIVFIEAMACGTPAFGFRAGGATDALADGELGLCVSEKEFPALLQDAILELAPDPEKIHGEIMRRFGEPVFRASLHRLVRDRLCI